MPNDAHTNQHPLTRLPREDLDLIAELVLQSGSLKGLAESYGVSYPTIRTRVDKVIERLRALLQGRQPDPLSEFLATLVERGQMNASTARQIRDLARRHNGAVTQEQQSEKETTP
jgi:hypothetical protein